MVLENAIAQFNVGLFFKEFTFAKNTFQPPTRNELELADHIIWLDDLLIVFQLKEREITPSTTPEIERNWFEKRVLGKATKQIRDTLSYLRDYDEIAIQNERGHSFNIVEAKIATRFNVIVYQPHPLLPAECLTKKHHISSTAGFIHLFSGTDYEGICRTLITPAEISEYLRFRESIIIRRPIASERLPEQALVGQYVYGDASSEPRLEFMQYLTELEQQREHFDFFHILDRIHDKINSSEDPYDYYRILIELAKLKRNELKEVKLRFDLCVKNCEQEKWSLPHRVICPRSSCGFVFVTVPPEWKGKELTALQNYTFANKYEHKLQKSVGVSVAKEGEYFILSWFFIEGDWKYEPELESFLAENYPFMPVRTQAIPRYNFKKYN
jgi:hypothetical protein